MNKGLNREFNWSSLVLYALPSIITMVFLSMYTIVDGMFVSRFVSTTALSATNIVYPITSLQLGVNIMLTSGASALISKKLGERKLEEAKENFTFIFFAGILTGAAFTVFGFLFIDRIVMALGSTESQFELAKTYALELLVFAPALFVQIYTQSFFAVAGKPNLTLVSSVLSGITNMVLDYFFIVVFDMGISGAAFGTGLGYTVSAVMGILYFLKVDYGLRFAKIKPDRKVLIKSCTNGISEMVTNLANAVTTFLFNIEMLKYYGDDGVAAITIVLYFQFVFSSVYLGYSTGIAPVIGYKYGEKNGNQLKKILKISLGFIVISSLVMFMVSYLTIFQTMAVFTDRGNNVYDISVSGFKLFAYSFLFVGFGIFGSAWFTALSNGKISAVISFLRTLVFIVAAIVILPVIIGVDGLWLSIPLAEFLAMLVSIYYIKVNRKKYGY